jgi:hypothetical protein
LPGVTLSSSSDTALPTDAAASEEFAVSLDRLFRVATIYGATHPAIAQAAAPVLASVQRLAGPKNEAKVKLVDQGALDVAGTQLPKTFAAAQRLRERLERAGLSGVAVGVAVSPADLCALGDLLRRRPVQGDASDPDGTKSLPATIRPLASWFGIPGEDGSATRARIEALVRKAFESHPLAPPLLKTHGDIAFEAFELLRERTEPADATSLRSCVGALRTALEARAEKGIDQLTLLDLLREVREVLKAATGEATATAIVDAVLDFSEQYLLEGFAAKPGAKPLDLLGARQDVVLERETQEVTRALGEAIGSAPVPAQSEFRCIAEYVSIQLQLLALACEPELLRAIESRLHAAFEQEGDREFDDALAGFVAEQCRDGEPARVDRSFAFLSGELRRGDPARFARLLADGLASGDARVVERVWPHLANELVLGLPAEALGVERRLLDRLLETPPELFTSAAARVAQLACVRTELDGRPRLLFAPPRVELRLLFLALASVPDAKSFGALLLRELREAPLPLPGAQAFAALRHADDRERRFLLAFLRQEGGANGAAALDRLAARTLVDALARLPVESRGEPWVVLAIGGLGALGSVEGDALLARVLSERRLFLFPTWPDVCRRKAREARERRAQAFRSRRSG